MNPTLSDLVGGIQSVTLGDEEARRRGTQKSILERRAPPTFDVVVEIQSWDSRSPSTATSPRRSTRSCAATEVPPEMRELTAEGEVRSVSGGVSKSTARP